MHTAPTVDPPMDVECLAGDVSAGLTGEADEWTVEGVRAWRAAAADWMLAWSRPSRANGDVLPRRSGGSAPKKRHP